MDASEHLSITMTLAEAKTWLEREGFLVIPRERMLKLQQNYCVSDYTQMKFGPEWSTYKEHLLGNMGRSMGIRIVTDHACLVSEIRYDPERGVSPCSNTMGTVIRVDARVILPKPEAAS